MIPLFLFVFANMFNRHCLGFRPAPLYSRITARATITTTTKMTMTTTTATMAFRKNLGGSIGIGTILQTTLSSRGRVPSVVVPVRDGSIYGHYSSNQRKYAPTVLMREMHSRETLKDCCCQEQSTEPTSQNNNVLSAYTLCKDYETMSKEDQWLIRTTCKILGPSLDTTRTHMIGVGKMPSSTIRRFPLIMRAWMKKCSIPNSNAALIVERLLEKLIDELEHGNDFVVTKGGILCTDLYNVVLESWANTSGREFYHKSDPSHHGGGINPSSCGGNHRFAAERANEILERMKSSTMDIIKPNEKSYLMVIRAWVKSRDPCAIDEIDGILKEFENRVDSQESDVKPTIEWYNYYLYALANSPSDNPKRDAECANIMLNQLKNKCLKDPRLRPDLNTYKQVISIQAKTRTFNGAVRAQSIFDEMMVGTNSTVLIPTTDIFNALMNCWLKSGSKRARHRIEQLLGKMMELRDIGHDEAKPDCISVNTAISAIAKSQRKDSVRKAYFILKNMQTIYGVEPDTTSYNLVIDAYSKSRDLQGGQKADNLLKEMELQFRQGNRGVMPNSYSYSTVIDAISNYQGCGETAEGLLDRMERLHQSHGGAVPDTVVYNSLMNVYASQGNKESIHRIQSIISFMEESFTRGNTNVKPNIVSYNTVLKAYAFARDDFTQDAKDLLDRLIMMSNHGNLSEITPDAVSYTTVISCYARSDVPWKAKIAQELLHQMVEAYKSGKSSNKPTIFTFNAVLNACAYTFNQNEKVDAFMVIVSTLVLLQEFTKPDHTTYGTLLKAWCNLIPKDDERRARIVRSVFRQCCKEGQVGNMVMQQLKYAATPELYRALTGKDVTQDIKISNLPTNWSKNVKERQGKMSRIS